MSGLLVLMAASMVTPPEPLIGQVRAAIWHDLELNALIGNWNPLAADWYSAAPENSTAPLLHIQDLKCQEMRKSRRCAFTLIRDGGVLEMDEKKIPAKIQCCASLVPDDDGSGLAVEHYPPPRRRGHSQTSMRCKVLGG